MQDQGFPGEESETQKPPTEGQFLLNLFAVDEKLKDPALTTATEFQNIANQVAKYMPEGAPRTVTLERLLDIKNAVIKAMAKGVPQ